MGSAAASLRHVQERGSLGLTSPGLVQAVHCSLQRRGLAVQRCPEPGRREFEVYSVEGESETTKGSGKVNTEKQIPENGQIDGRSKHSSAVLEVVEDFYLR